MRKATFIFGTRPEAIKLCPLIRAMRERGDFAPRICVTGQHREMLAGVLEAFDVAADADLELMRPDQSLSGLAARALEAVDAELAENRPDLALVQGDTTSAFCAALAAYHRRVPVGHVEAGLRTGDRFAPFPEEINRTLISRMADWHFAPTEGARQNLLREGTPEEAIFVTGNTAIDALRFAVERIRREPPAVAELPDFLQPGAGGAAPRLVLITGHRRESFGAGFEGICCAIAELAGRFPEAHFVYPVHLNPRVREPVERILGASGGAPSPTGNVHLIEPLDYLPFVALMDRSALILTDSGGVQEEAPSLGKPVLVLRDATERPEAVELGVVKLVGTDAKTIVAEAARLLADASARAAMARAVNPYGDGQASARILAALTN